MTVYTHSLPEPIHHTMLWNTSWCEPGLSGLQQFDFEPQRLIIPEQQLYLESKWRPPLIFQQPLGQMLPLQTDFATAVSAAATAMAAASEASWSQIPPPPLTVPELHDCVPALGYPPPPSHPPPLPPVQEGPVLSAPPPATGLAPLAPMSQWLYHEDDGCQAMLFEPEEPWSNPDEFVFELPAEPDEVLVVNSAGSESHRLLCCDAVEADTVAFDAEWRPDWSGSDNPISVLQLAFPISRRVYVVQVGRLGGKLPVEVQMMLVNPRVTKAGFAVDRSDIAKLQRTGIAVTRDSVVDVQGRCAEALGFLNVDTSGGIQAETLGLKRAAGRLLGVEMDKRLACSDWACDRLTPGQVRYAALDAWVTLRLFYRVA